MRKLIKSIVVLGILAGIMLFTCPEEEKHVDKYVKSQLKVEDYTLLNVGKMNYDGEKRVVTIGAFNHVFCLVKAYDLLDEIKAQ